MKLTEIGHWAFILGVAIAIITGLVEILAAETVAMLLVVLGLLVGLLNISEKEIQGFLVAAIALMVTGAAGLSDLPTVGNIIGPMLTNIATFVAPAAVIVALKAVFDLGKK